MTGRRRIADGTFVVVALVLTVAAVTGLYVRATRAHVKVTWTEADAIVQIFVNCRQVGQRATAPGEQDLGWIDRSDVVTLSARSPGGGTYAQFDVTTTAGPSQALIVEGGDPADAVGAHVWSRTLTSTGRVLTGAGCQAAPHRLALANPAPRSYDPGLARGPLVDAVAATPNWFQWVWIVLGGGIAAYEILRNTLRRQRDAGTATLDVVQGLAGAAVVLAFVLADEDAVRLALFGIVGAFFVGQRALGLLGYRRAADDLPVSDNDAPSASQAGADDALVARTPRG